MFDGRSKGKASQHKRIAGRVITMSLDTMPHTIKGEETLQAKLLEVSRELELAKQRLRQTELLAALGAAAAKICHEISNPLNVISTSVQLLERWTPADEISGERLRLIGRDVRNEVSRLESLIRDLREFSRPQKLDLKPVNLKQTIDEMRLLYKGEL